MHRSPPAWSARCWLCLLRMRHKIYPWITWRNVLTLLVVVCSVMLLRTSYREIHYNCLLGGEGQWAVGMAFGDSPFHLGFASVPSLTCLHVVDARDRQFLADPFMIKEVKKESPPALERDPIALPLPPNSPSYQRFPTKGKWYLFFEILIGNRPPEKDFQFQGDKGVIGVAWADNPLDNHWHYQQIVLEEDFHLSYPFVFHHQGEYFMIPETNEANSIRLYRAPFFPHRWEFVRTLIDGEPFVDASPVFFEGRWWIFTLLKNHDNPRLMIYYSNTDNLLSDKLQWTLHPLCPLYQGNNKYTRPGGRPIIHEGFIYRFTQDLTTPTTYGHFLHVMQVTELTPTTFVETEITSFHPIEKYTWMSKRIHHIDLHPRSELDAENLPKDGSPEQKVPGWFAVVDGNRYFYSPDLTFIIQVVTILLTAAVLLLVIYYPQKREILRKLMGCASSQLAACSDLLQAAISSATSTVSLPPPNPAAAAVASRYFPALRSHKKNLVTLIAVAMTILLVLYLWGYGLSLFGYPLCAQWQCIPTVSIENSGPVVIHPGPLPHHSPHRECPVTMVTALYDIGRGSVKSQEKMQSWDNYLSYFSTVLSVNACYVVHVAPETVDHVLYHRGCKMVSEVVIELPYSHLANASAVVGQPKRKLQSKRLVLKDCKYPTEIIVTSLEDLRDSYPLYERLAEIILDPKSREGVRRPDRVERIMPEYNLMMFLKMRWLHAAVASNPFDSSYLFWMDGGYGKGWYFGGREYHAKRWPDLYKVRKIVDPHQFFMVNVYSALKGIYRFCQAPMEVLAKNHTVTIAGGFFGGTAEAINQFAIEYGHSLNDTLTAGIVDDDQLILGMTYCRRPDMVQLHYCTHKFVPFQMICIESQLLSWGRYHCPIEIFAADP